jgi:hypothetical protein
MSFSRWLWTCDTCKAKHDGYPITCYCWRENITSSKWPARLVLPEIKLPPPKVKREKKEKNIVRKRYIDNLPEGWQEIYRPYFNPKYFEMTEKFIFWNKTYTEIGEEYRVSRQRACQVVAMVTNSILHKDLNKYQWNYETLSWESIYDRIARKRKELWHNL